MRHKRHQKRMEAARKQAVKFVCTLCHNVLLVLFLNLVHLS